MKGLFLLGEISNGIQDIDFSSLTSQLSNSLNPTTVLTIMGTVVGATAGIFLAVWGGRKIINAIQDTLKGGKIKG